MTTFKNIVIKIRVIVLVLLAETANVMSQDLPYARQIVDSLTAESMHGRGYINKGDHVAAHFIAGEYSKHGLQAFGQNFFQTFNFPVNTFPDDLEVRINNGKLIPGIDFIVDPACGNAEGVFEIITISGTPWQVKSGKIKNKIILIDKSETDSKQIADSLYEWLVEVQEAAGIIISEEKKLTWGVSTFQRPFPVIHILKQSLPAAPTEIFLKINARYREQHETQNVIGFIKGHSNPDSFLVFSAHYDHLGRMGKEAYFPGANDNASGMAMLLNLIQYYCKPENKPEYSMVFISFAGEEAGLIGSKFYTNNPLFPLSKIRFLINMDLLGTGDDGMMVVNGDVFKSEFDILTKINESKGYLKAIGKRGKARNSDHYYFSELGVPSFFFYTLGGISAYHDVNDIAGTLPFTDFEDVFRLILDFEDEITR